MQDSGGCACAASSDPGKPRAEELSPSHKEETEAQGPLHWPASLRPDPSLIHFPPPGPARPSWPWHPGRPVTTVMTD